MTLNTCKILRSIRDEIHIERWIFSAGHHVACGFPGGQQRRVVHLDRAKIMEGAIADEANAQPRSSVLKARPCLLDVVGIIE